MNDPARIFHKASTAALEAWQNRLFCDFAPHRYCNGAQAPKKHSDVRLAAAPITSLQFFIKKYGPAGDKKVCLKPEKDKQ